MEQDPFTVMVAGKAKLGMEDYVKQFLVKLMEHSRQDKGCILYNIHQSTEDPGEFMLYSIWCDEAAFLAHNQQPHMEEFKHKLAPELFGQQSPKTYWHLL